jgi:GT2 family glycosyltransferase
MSNFKISVVIPNWNGRKYLEKCLSSLIKQDFKDFEILLVDNGSMDGSVEYVEDNFKQVKCIKLQENQGFAKAVNIGIKASSADLIFLLNNDTQCPQDLLSNLYKEAKTEKDYLFFACKMINYYNREEIDSAGDRFAITLFHTQVFRIGAGEPVNKYNKKQEVFSACAGAALYRKEFFEKIGYFDEDFFAFQEDIDISFRAQLQGYRCLFLPSAKVYHLRGGTTANKSYWHIYYGHRNHIWLLVKNLPTTFFIRYFRQTILFWGFLLFLYNIVSIFVRNKKMIAKSKGLRHGFLKSFIFYKKRKEIQVKKKVVNKYINNLIRK